MHKYIFAVLFVTLTLCSPTMSKDGRSREEQLLKWMDGEWTFSLGDFRGERTVRVAYPDHLVAFEEVFDGADIRGEGYIGYSPTQNLFYDFSVHNTPGEFAFMTGVLDQVKDVIVYQPEAASSDANYEVEWEKISDNKFSYTAYDIGVNGSRAKRWIAVFIRKK